MHYVFESHTPTKGKAGQGNNYESEMMKGFLPDICLIRNKKLILFMFRLDALSPPQGNGTKSWDISLSILRLAVV